MAEEKTLGRVCYEAWYGAGVEKDVLLGKEWERTAQAVVGAYRARKKRERKGKRLRELEARVVRLEDWCNLSGGEG